ncbi:But2 family protein [Schizosaccharomyces octosporus yFS286]|uniref:But2 family protein n=1 Tax=Schizosaccharomyces octosporus (strain yFS286) TaxID=483514 RepID=S9Q5I5_SCHOY|nr:But2 family protein [Schizosaccharomyces octosporus yFS286]EPX75327.1 But2 family protein [Schizosaccharomyces octosporus yFS286]
MKFSLSAVFLTLLGAGSALAAPISNSQRGLSSDQKFGIMSLRSGNINVHLHSFYVGESGQVYLEQYDHAKEAASFNLKDSQLLYNNEPASLGKDGALVFQPSGSSLSGFNADQGTNIGYELSLNGSFPLACPVADNSGVYQIFYGQGNGNKDCVGISTEAIV